MADVPPPELLDPAADAGARAKGTWLGALGLSMVGAGPSLMLLAAILWGLDVGEDIAFFLTLALVPLVGAYLVWRFGTWSKVVGIVLAVLGGGMMFWTAFGLFTPQAFFDFMPALLVIPGAIIAIVGCVQAIRARKRDRLTQGARGGERTTIRVVLAILAVLGLVSGVLTFMGSTSGAAGEADVVAHDFKFAPQTVSVAAGDKIVVRNDDPFFHTFTIDELDVDVALDPGGEFEVEVGESGTYVFYCQPHTSDPSNPSEDDMTGEITVE